MIRPSAEFIRLKEVIQMTSLSKSEIYRRIREGRFPHSIRLGHRIAVWKKGDVLAWKRGIIISELLN
ncbi:transcriptional regulator [Hyphomonas polymorpha PS728]|uniref:Transcriptional regulator n=1 Tax=Hyphomonas polymorpha PS728 TaxID=1280954 RepID=A0A062VDM6_9PROT|nr:transcriptional regulator [Hyphomonas polymorpha PS728]